MERFQVGRAKAALHGAFRVVLAGAILIGPAIGASADSSSSLVFSGTVGSRTVLAISRQVATGGLQSDPQGRDTFVALVSEQSNLRAGYRISLALVNSADGLLEKPLLSTATLSDRTTHPWVVSYGGAQVVFSSGSAVVSDMHRPNSPSATATELRVSREAAQLSSPDALVDTLILSVEAR